MKLWRRRKHRDVTVGRPLPGSVIPTVTMHPKPTHDEPICGEPYIGILPVFSHCILPKGHEEFDHSDGNHVW